MASHTSKNAPPGHLEKFYTCAQEIIDQKKRFDGLIITGAPVEVGKSELPEKMFGVFPHRVLDRGNSLVRGFDDVFYIPVSRHTSIDEAALYKCPDLTVLAASDESGVGLAMSRDGRRVFATGHSEYDAYTLDAEYRRDFAQGLPIEPPRNYYIDGDPDKGPRELAELLCVSGDAV
jgi:homoserine O-succinyltransferase